MGGRGGGGGGTGHCEPNGKKLHLSFCERGYSTEFIYCAVRRVKITAEGLRCWVILFYSYFSNRNVILLTDEVPSKPAPSDNNGTFDS